MNMSNICYRDTLGDMARRAATKYGDKTAIIFRDQKISFYDLERQARRFANLMTSYGVKKGDRVAIYAYNSPYYPLDFGTTLASRMTMKKPKKWFISLLKKELLTLTWPITMGHLQDQPKLTLERF